MIVIKVEFDGGGVLRSCHIAGHAGAGERGFDIVCAAVSVLARTLVRTLSGRQGIHISSSVRERGIFELSVRYDEAGRDFLAAVGAFALEGFKSLAEEYPDFLSLTS